MEKVCELAADRDMPGHMFRQPNVVLGRMVNQSANLIDRYEPFYADAPHFRHLAEMFTGTERSIDPTPVHKLHLPEFRLVSNDPETAAAIRDLDILGRDILFNQTRSCPLIEAEHERRLEPGLYRITRPKDHIERQVLCVLVSFVQDYTEGSIVFMEKVAVKSHLVKRKVPNRKVRNHDLGTRSRP